MINISLNQVLSRTIITSFTTLLVLLAMLFVGGDAIRGFAEALIMGITVGTYSSLYVVTNVLLYMEVSKEDLMVPVREDSDQDSMP